MAVRPPDFGTKQLFTALGASVLYAAISLLFDPSRSEFIRGSVFVTFTPAIFFPAVVAILYGPLVGAIAAGFGTLLFDVTSNSILRPVEPLLYYHFVNFIGHLFGGYFAGLLAKPAKDASTLFNVNPDKINTVGDYFNLSYLRRLFRNTMAAIVGLGFITGIVLGYGQQLEPIVYPASQPNSLSAFEQFIQVSYSQGVVLLFSIPVVIMIYSIVDYELDHRATLRLQQRRKLSVQPASTSDLEVVSVYSPEGDELWNLSWGAIRMMVKNISNRPIQFTFRVSSNDMFSPHRDHTPRLRPGETDEIYFNVYGISPGEKSAFVYVRGDDPESENRLTLKYKMGSSSEILINKLVGLFLVVGLLISTVLVVINLGEQAFLSPQLILAMLALPVEIIVILVLYWVWNLRVTDNLLKAFHLREDNTDVSFLIDTMEEDDINLRKEQIKQLKYQSRIFLAIASLIFLIISLMILLQVVGILFIGQRVVISLVLLLTLVLLISDILIEQADSQSSTVLTQKELQTKVIRSAIAESRPEKFVTTLIVLRVHNPFETKGMRISIHSLDNVSPKEIILRDLVPDQIRAIALEYTPLDHGNREIAFEFIQYRYTDGTVVPHQQARTFDQESLRVTVSGTRIFGLSTSQIRLLRRVITTIGAITLSISILASLLQLSINQDTIDTTIPLVIILQAPVIWLVLFLRNRFQKSLDPAD